MKNLFVPFEQALHLKELGFDEPCMFPYHRNNTDYIDSTHVELANYNATEKLVSAVLYQQAFRFFREKYGLFASFVEYTKDILPEIYYMFTLSGGEHYEDFNTYEEAENACIKKLIEICQNK